MGLLVNFVLSKIRGGKLLQLKSALEREEDFNREICFESKRSDLERFDVVDLTNVKIADNMHMLEKQDFREALRKPPLYDFVFRINDSEGNTVEFLLHCYGKHSNAIFAKDGRTYIPLLDISQLNQKREVVAIMQVLTPKSRYMTDFHTRPVAVDRCDSISSYKEMVDFLEIATDYVLWHYTYMATKFKNCPERFTRTGQGGRKVFTMGAEPVKPLRETKVERSIAAEEDGEKTTGTETPEDADDAHRKIACPYWTVRGHERHLKNGKIIWIEPYAKGKDRKNPEKNVPKKYTI